MIPEGWQRTTLGKVAKITSGGTPDRNRSEYWGGSIPWVTTGEIGNGSIMSTSEHITECGLKHSSAKLFPAGTLLMAMYGQGKTRGKIAQLKIKATTNQACAAILTKSTSDASFLFQNLTARYDEIRNLSNDGSQKNLSGGLLKALPILLPPLSEQRRVTGILSTWDRAIETVEALIAGARAQKQALMQQLLPQGTTPPQKRLPGFSGEWKQRTVTQLGRVESGGTPASGNPTYWGGDIAWVTPGEITKQQTRHLATTERTITKDGLAESSTKLLPAGSVIVCTRATVGELAIATGPITTNQGFKNIVPSDRHDSDFIYYLLLHNKKALNRVAAGSTFAEVSKADFERLTFIVPALEEQRAIAGILIDSDETIQLRSTQLSALRREKAALMQQLLTGKRRVAVAENVDA